MDDLSNSGISGLDRHRQQGQTIDIGNKRVLYKASSCCTDEKVSSDSLCASNTSILSKPSHQRTNGFRGNLYKGEQLLTQRTNKSNSGQDSEELIAMGTLWIPISNGILSSSSAGGTSSGQGFTISSSSSIISKSSVLGTQSTNGSRCNNSSNNNAGPYRKSSDSHMRLPFNSGTNGISNSMLGVHLNNNSNKDGLKYQDPLMGAPASFQQRLMELASLEADTIRWERSRKVKKKPKPDRDS